RRQQKAACRPHLEVGRFQCALSACRLPHEVPALGLNPKADRLIRLPRNRTQPRAASGLREGDDRRLARASCLTCSLAANRKPKAPIGLFNLRDALLASMEEARSRANSGGKLSRGQSVWEVIGRL